MSPVIERKLTTILAADAEGYSRLMDRDEVGALTALRDARQVFTDHIRRRGGRIANTAGDGLIAEFPSVVEAVQCAIDVQKTLQQDDAGRDRLHFRIGIHLGDVMVEGDDLLGEGVNLAARLQTMAEPDGILVSHPVVDQVEHKLSATFDYLGEKRPKNFTKDVGVYRVIEGGKIPGHRPEPTHTEPAEPYDVAAGPQPDLRAQVKRHACRFGVLWAGLLLIDLVTGSPFWAHWPGLAVLIVLGLKAAPLAVPSGFKLQLARGGVIVGALILINLFTWAGYPWALWPAAALIVAELVRRVGERAA